MDTTGNKRKLLTNKEAAAYLGYSEKTLTKWRCTREEHIPFYRGNPVRYDVADLDRWLESRKVS
jgi:excisionase family DNA binding protein